MVTSDGYRVQMRQDEFWIEIARDIRSAEQACKMAVRLAHKRMQHRVLNSEREIVFMANADGSWTGRKFDKR